MNGPDAYDKIDYRRLISWSTRLEREWPFLRTQLGRAPERSVVDLGCGPGEHLARLAREGWRTLGIDRSSSQVASARTHHPEVEFAEGSMEDLAELTRDSFGAALCVGNALPSLDDSVLDRTLAALHARLLPGGIFLVQLLDYTRILSGKKRALPVTLRPNAEGDETVFLRVYLPDPDPRFVRFVPATLRLRAEGDPPLEMATVDSVRHRAWTAEELEARLEATGFCEIRRFGGLDGSDHDDETSDDLVLVAQRG